MRRLLVRRLLGAGFAANGTQLILWRIVQGIGGAFIFANGPALVTDAFPLSHTTPETLALAEAALAGDLPAAVRRSLTDGTDALRRAVTSVGRFG